MCHSKLDLIGVFFDLGKERTTELPLDQPYYLRISIVYESVKGPATRRVAEECAKNITDLFHKTFGLPSHASEIILESCEAVADTFISLADMRKVDLWRVEYISLREDPPGECISIGETPI